MTVTSYANGTDFLARYDARLIGDLVRDDGTQENPATLPTNTNLLTALCDAYGDIVSAAVVGDRYTVDQLDPANLSPAALSYLIRLNCDIALIMIKRRRGKFDLDSWNRVEKKERICEGDFCCFSDRIPSCRVRLTVWPQ